MLMVGLKTLMSFQYRPLLVPTLFCHAHYCDFVVWTQDALVIQQLYLDEPFITIALEKCKQFVKLGVLPELLGKWYSREPVASISSTGDEQVEECACGDVMLLLQEKGIRGINDLL